MQRSHIGIYLSIYLFIHGITCVGQRQQAQQEHSYLNKTMWGLDFKCTHSVENEKCVDSVVMGAKEKYKNYIWHRFLYLDIVFVCFFKTPGRVISGLIDLTKWLQC